LAIERCSHAAIHSTDLICSPESKLSSAGLLEDVSSWISRESADEAIVAIGIGIASLKRTLKRDPNVVIRRRIEMPSVAIQNCSCSLASVVISVGSNAWSHGHGDIDSIDDGDIIEVQSELRESELSQTDSSAASAAVLLTVGEVLISTAFAFNAASDISRPDDV